MKAVGLLGPGSKIRRYIPVYECPNDGALRLRGQWWLQVAVLLKVCGDKFENSGMATGFGKLSTKRHPKI